MGGIRLCGAVRGNIKRGSIIPRARYSDITVILFNLRAGMRMEWQKPSI